MNYEAHPVCGEGSGRLSGEGVLGSPEGRRKAGNSGEKKINKIKQGNGDE
jgi:hypothetical protein